MKEKQFFVGEGSERLLLAFNINVLADIQEKYGTLDAWISKVSPSKASPTGSLRDMVTGFTYMANEGVSIQNDEAGEEIRKPFTERQIGRHISSWGTEATVKAMREAVVGSVPEVDDSKKGSSTKKKATQS